MYDNIEHQKLLYKNLFEKLGDFGCVIDDTRYRALYRAKWNKLKLAILTYSRYLELENETVENAWNDFVKQFKKMEIIDASENYYKQYHLMWNRLYNLIKKYDSLKGG